MKRFFTLAMLISCSLCALAALDSVPAPSNVAGAEFPRIASDLSVMFQLEVRVHFAISGATFPSDRLIY
jgi:hypothetical protein